MGFPDSSAGKESACNASDPVSNPGLGGSAGKGISYPLQYSWASLVIISIELLERIQNSRVYEIQKIPENKFSKNL